MMDAILYRLRRLRGIRAERFRYCIRRCAERSHRSRLCIFADMLICYFLYGAVYTDYLLFGFDTLPFCEKRNYLTRTRFRRLALQADPPLARSLLNSKYSFYEHYPEQLHRTILRSDAPDEDLRAFFQKNPRFVLKPDDGTGGEGVRIVSCAEYRSERELFGAVRSKRGYLLEELISQHPGMAYFNEDSINTLRLVFLKTEFLYCSLRLDRKGSPVDNLCSGGMVCAVNTKTCRVVSDAYDNDGNRYRTHPDRGTVVFRGSPVPYLEEAVSLCRKVAGELYRKGGAALVGFDAAVTPFGAVIVEANAFPTHYGWQRPGFIDENTPTALMPRIREILNKTVRDQG